MADREPYKWITVKGKHIPVYKDEYGQDVFGNGREEYKSSEEMAKSIVGENDPYFQGQRKQLADTAQSLQDKRNKIDIELSDLKKQLDKESFISEEDNEMFELLGASYKGLFKHYTDKGKEIQSQMRLLEDERNKIKDDLDYNKSQLSGLNRYTRMQQQNEWLQRIQSQSTMQEHTKNSYQGFKLNESTVTPIDEALKSGQARIVEMSPKEYLERANYQIFTKYTLAQNIVGRSHRMVNEYAEMMRQGVKFDTPYLDYEGIVNPSGALGQEGMHRALAAIQNGYKRIPVIVVSKKKH